MPIKLKQGAKLTGVSTEMCFATIIVGSHYDAILCDCIITSGSDGEHSQGSEHYKGDALDYRTHNVPPSKRARLVQEIREALGEEFDVLHEGAGTSNEHLHVEYDPKRGVNK